MTPLYTLSAVEMADLIASGQLSPIELAEHYLDRIERLDPQLHAFVNIDPERIRLEARAAQEEVARGCKLGPLHGLPVCVKDLIVTKGIPTTRGSRIFASDMPTFDSPVVERLRGAGGILFGKTNTSEFGWKGATSNTIFPETTNPWNLEYSPGGSSGGAAAAMSAGLAALAIGTDGGGSIRIPAALTGVFGFKPSIGRWPVFPASGVGPLSHSGPITRNVNDAGLLFRTLAGPDDRDCYSVPLELFPDRVDPIENLRIGWSPDLGFMRVDKQIRDIVEAAVHRFEVAGCRIVQTKVEIGDPTPTVATYFAAGSAAAISRYPDWQDIVDPGLVKLIQSYSKLTAVDFAAAQLHRAEICSKIASLYGGIDLLATPTVPMSAFQLGMDGPGLIDGEEVDNIRWLGLTSVFNLTGQPAASMPAGFTSDGLPVGLQLVGPRFQDWLVLRASQTMEQISKWPTMWPDIARTN